MEKVSKFLIFIFIMGMFFSACQKENLDKITTEKEKPTIEFVEGRLHFDSSVQLGNKIAKLKKLDETALQNEMAGLYKDGFKPLKPFYRENDFELKQEYATKKALKMKSFVEDIDDGDELIGDEFFASVLNEDREIQVGDSIYKYTEQGLFFCHIDDIDELELYLENLKLKSSFKNVPVDPCEMQLQEFGVQPINAYVKRYIPYPDCGGGPGGGSTGDGPTGGGSTSNYGDTFVNNLTKCDERYRDLKIFGDIVSCIDKFDTRHRVKTKFFKQNYLLYSAIGISAKHQTRVLGIFWTNKTDEIRLGVNAIYFEYKMPLPDYNNIVKTYIIYQGKVYDNYLNILNAGKVVIPKLPFDDQFNTITIYAALPIIGVIDKNFTEEDVNKAFWKAAWPKAVALAKKLGKPAPKKASLVGFNREKTIVQHYNTEEIAYNDGKLMKLYDFNFLITFDFMDLLNKVVSWRSFKIQSIYNYEKAKIDIYGAARKGSTWKGSRIIWKD